RAGNADGLDDWVVFNARKGADELAEARLELREVRRLAAEHPDAVVRMGRERHAPERPGVPGERSKEFDIRVDRAGVPERSVEVTTVGDGVNNVGAFTNAVRHGADKAAQRLAEGQPIPGVLEVSVSHRLAPTRSLGRGRVRLTHPAGNGTVETRDATGAVRHTQDAGNLYVDCTGHGATIKNSERLDRITLVEETSGRVRIYLNEGGTWRRTQ